MRLRVRLTGDEPLRLAQRDGWSLRLARVRGDVRAVLDADGIIERLGRRQLHSKVDTAVSAELEARTSIPPGPAATEPHEHRDAGGGGPLR